MLRHTGKIMIFSDNWSIIDRTGGTDNRLFFQLWLASLMWDSHTPKTKQNQDRIHQTQSDNEQGKTWRKKRQNIPAQILFLIT